MDLAINAGVTHPLVEWLDAMSPSGKMILPVTATMGAMGNIGKGLVFLVRRDADDTFSARVTGVVAVYSAVGLREESLNPFIGKLMMTGPQQWTSISRLRRDPHEPALTCRLHGAHFCLSS